MARIRRHLDPHGQGAQVRQQLKREPAGWRRERLLAVKLGLDGQLDLEEIAAYLGRARSCIQGWLERFRRGGLEALLQPPTRGQGPASALPPELAQALGQKLAAGEFRRAADAQRWLLEEGGLCVKLTTVYKYLKKAGARLKVPRPCHEKKDRWAAEAFREALAVHLVGLDLPADRPVRFWVADLDALRPAARHAPGVEFAGHPARLPGLSPLRMGLCLWGGRSRRAGPRRVPLQPDGRPGV